MISEQLHTLWKASVVQQRQKKEKAAEKQRSHQCTKGLIKKNNFHNAVIVLVQVSGTEKRASPWNVTHRHAHNVRSSMYIEYMVNLRTTIQECNTRCAKNCSHRMWGKVIKGLRDKRAQVFFFFLFCVTAKQSTRHLYSLQGSPTGMLEVWRHWKESQGEDPALMG